MNVFCGDQSRAGQIAGGQGAVGGGCEAGGGIVDVVDVDTAVVDVAAVDVVAVDVVAVDDVDVDAVDVDVVDVVVVDAVAVDYVQAVCQGHGDGAPQAGGAIEAMSAGQQRCFVAAVASATCDATSRFDSQGCEFVGIAHQIVPET